MVVGDGFEPSKAVPADLQSAPFSHSGIPPNGAGKGGRTPLTSLEGWCTADMPYPHDRFKVFLYHFRKNGTDEGSRTLKPCGTRT